MAYTMLKIQKPFYYCSGDVFGTDIRRRLTTFLLAAHVRLTLAPSSAASISIHTQRRRWRPYSNPDAACRCSGRLAGLLQRTVGSGFRHRAEAPNAAICSECRCTTDPHFTRLDPPYITHTRWSGFCACFLSSIFIGLLADISGGEAYYCFAGTNRLVAGIGK